MLEWMSSRKGFNTSFTDLKDINFWRGWGNRTINTEPVSIFSINISNVKNNKVVGIKTKDIELYTKNGIHCGHTVNHKSLYLCKHFKKTCSRA